MKSKKTKAGTLSELLEINTIMNFKQEKKD